MMHREMIEEKIEGSIASMRILLVEDEPDMALQIASDLEDLGYIIDIANTAATALEFVRSNNPSLIIADRMLNGVDTITMIEKLRSDGVHIPVIFASALASVDERILGLKAGSDDYIIKPFVIGELAARVEAVFRSSALVPNTKLRAGSLELDLIERCARRGDRQLKLLPREFKLLEYLIRHANQIVTRAMLLEEVWNYRFLPQTNLIDVHIGKVRKKVDGPGETRLIQSVRNAGFMLQTAD
jgi:two-component system OmpR family response regulator